MRSARWMKLELLSGIGPKAELKEHDIECHLDAPQVGSNLEDHFCGSLFCKSAKKDIGAVNLQMVGLWQKFEFDICL